MAIDARIDRVTYEPDGTATLHLGQREKSAAGPGQPQLTVVNPRPGMEVLEGECIWGGFNFIMYRDHHWADRLSYTTIRLREPNQEPT